MLDLQSHIIVFPALWTKKYLRELGFVSVSQFGGETTVPHCWYMQEGQASHVAQVGEGTYGVLTKFQPACSLPFFSHGKWKF